VDQVVYDGGRTRQAVRSAELAYQISGEEGRRARAEVLAGVARAYYGALLAEANLQAAREALRSAEADLKRAELVRAAGMSTDVDVLSIRVHVADVQEQRIRRAADLDVARAALNDTLGIPLDASHPLTTKLEAADVPDISLQQYERGALTGRPEARQAKFAASLAQAQITAARTSRGGAYRLWHPPGSAARLCRPSRGAAAHRSGTGGGRRSGGELAHHPEPL
jgi:outer membrane protein TolC